MVEKTFQYKMYINGKWVDAKNGEKFDDLIRPRENFGLRFQGEIGLMSS